MLQAVEDIRSNHKTKKNAQHWKNWNKKHMIASFYFFYSLGGAKVQGPAEFTTYRKYLPLEPFLSFPIKVYRVGIVPVCLR